jgi:hypothetical protein
VQIGTDCYVVTLLHHWNSVQCVEKVLEYLSEDVMVITNHNSDLLDNLTPNISHSNVSLCFHNRRHLILPHTTQKTVLLCCFSDYTQYKKSYCNRGKTTA